MLIPPKPSLLVSLYISAVTVEPNLEGLMRYRDRGNKTWGSLEKGVKERDIREPFLC